MSSARPLPTLDQAPMPDRAPARLSVVIPCRNGAATIGDQLERLQDQAVPVATEIIVADNGSTDDTMAVIARVGVRSIPVRVVDASASVGINHARNAGVRAAAGEFIVLCDADDTVAPGWLQAMWDAACAGADLAGGSLERIEADGSSASPPSEALLDYLGFLPWPAGANCGFRRDVYDAVGGFDERYRGGGDETDFFWRAQLAGRRIEFVPEARIRYVARPTLADRWRQQRRYGRSHVLLYQRFRDRGMPRSRTRTAVRFWGELPYRTLIALRHPAQRPQLVSRLAQRVGRLQASAALRTWYP